MTNEPIEGWEERFDKTWPHTEPEHSAIKGFIRSELSRTRDGLRTQEQYERDLALACDTERQYARQELLKELREKVERINPQDLEDSGEAIRQVVLSIIVTTQLSSKAEEDKTPRSSIGTARG